jgi:NOL1/NOP2/fmu family ribosome biogenesis protein
MAEFLKSAEKRELMKEVEAVYGLSDIGNCLLIETGKKKVRAFSGSMSKDEIVKLAKLVKVELVGMYMFSRKDAEPRINFDALTLLRDKITKNIFELNDEQFQMWIRGMDLDVSTRSGTIVLKYGEDLVGVGKSNGEKIFNYIPKERKLKTPLPKS